MELYSFIDKLTAIKQLTKEGYLDYEQAKKIVEKIANDFLKGVIK